ncbi:Mov34/MPN/PAD-1 family protein [Natrinema sp. 1APR25-10V2]|uniref:Mov34/MPN/PAD-1 family protein n=1 Tax=Natrinema sp. 1APR25-10V2 TaxID=2951081 RepID=UPI00287699FC|nr:Mov34/MPN/PAD-1 family protein [Natrinema sp. 1APR25-10V2]MDS0476813.1 Mov34/MPN/PAD-1 family protein [Natrinema sp. 1APR25-10V2]
MRGTFVFPGTDTDFIQLIELRGNNGAQDDVETVFVLTGETYYVPTRLFAFDDPTHYREATPTAVDIDNRAVAQTIADFYEERVGPRLVARFHTHPGGNPMPSTKDKRNAAKKQRVFDRYFDDYELFLGIHVLGEPCDLDPDWLRRPEQTATNAVSWRGEHRTHTLALYNGRYESRSVVVG